jgi:hypothetical protein
VGKQPREDRQGAGSQVLLVARPSQLVCSPLSIAQPETDKTREEHGYLYDPDLFPARPPFEGSERPQIVFKRRHPTGFASQFEEATLWVSTAEGYRVFNVSNPNSPRLGVPQLLEKRPRVPKGFEGKTLGDFSVTDDAARDMGFKLSPDWNWGRGEPTFAVWRDVLMGPSRVAVLSVSDCIHGNRQGERDEVVTSRPTGRRLRESIVATIWQLLSFAARHDRHPLPSSWGRKKGAR